MGGICQQVILPPSLLPKRVWAQSIVCKYLVLIPPATMATFLEPKLKDIVKHAGGNLVSMSAGMKLREPSRSWSAPEAETAPVHFLYHVPKCAGRTIDRHLAAALPRPTYHRIRKRRGLGRFITRYDATNLPDPRRAKVVGGHHIGISLDSIFGGRPVKRSILLRDPASHFVSYYNYRMTRYISEGLQPYGIEIAYGATQRNFITHYILKNFLELSWARIARLSDDDKYDLANAFLAKFWFVGDYQLCDELIAALGKGFGIPARATPRNTVEELVQNVGWMPVTMERLPSRVIAEIRAENVLDQRLWETWREVRHETNAVRPVGLDRRASSFISHEASRFVNQILRRIQRRWGSFDDAVPVMQGDPAAPA